MPDLPSRQSSVSPWVLKIAQEMLTVAERADRMGELTFTWAGKTLIRVERSPDKGLVVMFPEGVR